MVGMATKKAFSVSRISSSSSVRNGSKAVNSLKNCNSVGYNGVLAKFFADTISHIQYDSDAKFNARSCYPFHRENFG